MLLKYRNMAMGVALLMSIAVCASAAESDTPKNSQADQSKIIQSETYVSPFAGYQAFVEFMQKSPVWSVSALERSFPPSLYETCFDSDEIEFSEVIYQTPNGYTRGWVLRPQETEAELPIVIFNRGGFAKWGRVYPFELLSLCQVATQGFMVLASDFRGVENSALTGEQDVTDLGYGDVNDNFYFLEAVNQKYSDLDTENIAVWGFSRGTTLAALMATRAENINLVIMQGMVADLVNNARREEFDEHVYPLIVDGYSNLSKSRQDELLSGISPINLIDEVKGKPYFLIFHGAQDERASASDSLIYASELVNRGYSVDYHLYSDSGHSFGEKFSVYIDEVISGLKQHLLPD